MMGLTGDCEFISELVRGKLVTGPSRRWPFLTGRGGGSPWSSDWADEIGRDTLSGRSAGNRDGKAGAKSVCSRYGL